MFREIFLRKFYRNIRAKMLTTKKIEIIKKWKSQTIQYIYILKNEAGLTPNRNHGSAGTLALTDRKHMDYFCFSSVT